MANLINNLKHQVPGENIKGIAWHWYDFTCPFCYVSKTRSEILTGNGFDVISVPFQAHPDIPPEGIYIGERKGPMYDLLEKEVIPMYYDNPSQWMSVTKNGMRDILPQFDSNRMAREYYERLYSMD